MTENEALSVAKAYLAEAGIETARFEAKQLCGFLADGGEIDEGALYSAMTRRKNGEPLQYIIGEWEFYSLPFSVGKGVLIPRPDTEFLCDLGIEFIGDRTARCIDLCSGSGCVAIALDKNCKNAEVFALEKYDEAVFYLEKNIARNNSRVKVIKGDVQVPAKGEYDLILSNPPYIKRGALAGLQKEVGFEPKTALDGGEDGLMFYREILKNYLPCLKKGGMLAVEIGFDQRDEVVALFCEAGLSSVGSKKDFGGNERVVFGTLDDI